MTVNTRLVLSDLIGPETEFAAIKKNNPEKHNIEREKQEAPALVEFIVFTKIGPISNAKLRTHIHNKTLKYFDTVTGANRKQEQQVAGGSHCLG